MLGEWLPDEFHRLIFIPLCLVLIVKASKEPSIKAHICKETWVTRGVAEGVHVPADSRADPEFLLKELMSKHHVVNHVLIVSARLIMHAPPAVYYLQTSLLNQLPYLVLHIVALLPPPHAEELHLHVCELFLRIHHQLIDYRVDNQLDAGLCHVLVGSSEVLVDSFEPAHIVMRVGDQMHSDLPVPEARLEGLQVVAELRVRGWALSFKGIRLLGTLPVEGDRVGKGACAHKQEQSC